MKGKPIAVAGLLGSLTMVILYLASVVPVGQVGLVALAGLVPGAVLVSCGWKVSALCYGGCSILAFVLLPHKGNALLFLLLFGLYPLVKYFVEQLHILVLEIVLKLCFFNGVMIVLYSVAQQLLLDNTLLERFGLLVFWVGANLIFLAYDYGFSKLMYDYTKRVAPHIS